jgi:chromosome segregation ATPase
MVTGFFVFQQPQVSELTDQVDQLTMEKSDLESQVASLQDEVDTLKPFENENRELQATLAEANLHVRVLTALKDVQAAQLDLADEDIDAARLSLTRTETRLEEIKELLPSDQQGVVDGMIQRLNLVLDGIDGDAFAAQSDLEVLANSLIQLENTLFVAP